MTTYEAFPRSRGKAVVILLTGVFLAVMGLYLLFGLPSFEVHVGAVSSGSGTFGFLALLVSPLSIIQGLWFLGDREPALTLTEEGFVDRTGVLSPGFVRWDEVAVLRPTRFFLVGVKTTNWPRVRKRLPLWRRLLSILSFQFLGSDFHVSAFGVAMRRADLLRMLRARHERTLRAMVVADPPGSTNVAYVEDRRRLTKILVVAAAVLTGLPWLFSHGFVWFDPGPWKPVEWLPWGIDAPRWLMVSASSAILLGLLWDVVARRFWRPVTLRLNADGITYRTLSLPWSAITRAYLVRPDAIGVELELNRLAALDIPLWRRLRMTFDRLRGAPHLTLSVAGADFTGTTALNRVLSHVVPGPPPNPRRGRDELRGTPREDEHTPRTPVGHPADSPGR